MTHESVLRQLLQGYDLPDEGGPWYENLGAGK